MIFGKKKSALSRHDALAAKPLRLTTAELLTTESGARITVPFRHGRFAEWLLRVPKGVSKTFELDDIGIFVWENCDGKTSVQQIIRRLAKQYNLNLREAEVPTVQFLKMLASRGLIGMEVKD